MPEVGRLLVEVLNLTNLNSGITNLSLNLYLDESDEPLHSSQVAIREGQSLYTTQFPLHSTKQQFHLSFFVPMQFRPDVRLGKKRKAVLIFKKSTIFRRCNRRYSKHRQDQRQPYWPNYSQLAAQKHRN